MVQVKPKERKVSVLLLRDGKPEAAGEYGETDNLTSETPGGLTINLADVFQEVITRN